MKTMMVRIAAGVGAFLKPSGWVLVEIGSTQDDAVRALFADAADRAAGRDRAADAVHVRQHLLPQLLYLDVGRRTRRGPRRHPRQGNPGAGGEVPVRP